MIGELVVAPFAEYAFMRRALVGCLALALGVGPIGVFLMLRRMSLVGDALSHAVLPGAAIGYLWGGLALAPMGLGGFAAGIVVALLSGLVARATPLREDASFAGFYLVALALGVLIVSAGGSGVDLVHVLFGSVLAVDDEALLLMAAVATTTLIGLALMWRPLVVECFDPTFLKVVDGGGTVVHAAFLTLVVLNLVAGFLALGTLMAVGLMMVPAATARFWSRRLGPMIAAAAIVAFASGLGGLLLSFHADLPSGPAIVLTAGTFYVASIAVGRRDSLWRRFRPAPHLEA
jgi:zinc/manganese transport system permease protein